MSNHFKFFELQTPADLYSKLENDLILIKETAQDSKSAFNFFVTAEHLPDWLNQRSIVKDHCILRIVSHIANGAKHFQLNDKRHKSVTSTEKFRVCEEGCYEPGIFYEPLLIHLSENEAKELNKTKIDVLELAEKVLEFWKPYV